MARTYRNDTHKKWYSKESKANRKSQARNIRRETKQALQAGELDKLPSYTKTQGWMTH